MKRNTWKRVLCVLLACLLVFGLAACGAGKDSNMKEENKPSGGKPSGENRPSGGSSLVASFESGLWKRFALGEVDYPEYATCPNEGDYYNEKTGNFDSKAYSAAHDLYWKDLQARRAYLDQISPEALAEYCRKTFGIWLDGEENNVYSPVNVYMALAMLAEVSGGESRAQLLSLLGAPTIEDLRSWAQGLWRLSNVDDGVYTSLLNASIWVNDKAGDLGYEFDQQTIAELALHYYATVFCGTMGEQDFTEAFRSWLSEQTHGMLDAQIAQLELKDDMLMCLATTIYMKGRWQDEFGKYSTEKDTFHGVKGDAEVDFMHQSRTRTYYVGEHFSAISLGIINGGAMWIILPDEGYSTAKLLKDAGAANFLASGGTEGFTDSANIRVNISLPKFDVASDLSLIDGLKALGVTDVFDPKKANFEPLFTKGEEAYVSQVQHAGRVKVDEEGFEAAAYTVVMMAAGSAMPPNEEIDFVCDRPFLFAITNSEGMPLFLGTVNELE